MFNLTEVNLSISICYITNFDRKTTPIWV